MILASLQLDVTTCFINFVFYIQIFLESPFSELKKLVNPYHSLILIFSFLWAGLGFLDCMLKFIPFFSNTLASFSYWQTTDSETGLTYNYLRTINVTYGFLFQLFIFRFGGEYSFPNIIIYIEYLRKRNPKQLTEIPLFENNETNK